MRGRLERIVGAPFIGITSILSGYNFILGGRAIIFIFYFSDMYESGIKLMSSFSLFCFMGWVDGGGDYYL